MARRRSPIFTAIDPKLVGSGLQPDKHSLLKVLWETASSVVFWNGTVRRKIPAGLAFDTLTGARIAGIGQQLTSDGSRWLWAGSKNEIWRWRFSAPEQITAAFGTYVEDASATQDPTMYDFTPYGDWMIINAGFPAEPAKIWKPSALTVYAAGEAPVGVVKFIKALSFMVAVGYGARGTHVGWSDANNIEVFTASSTNTAGSLAIDEFNTPIRAASKLGQNISVYAADQMAIVSYIGAPFYFGQRTALDGIGCVGKLAVACDTKINVGMGRAGAWWTDGNTVRYIDEGFISTYFQDNINWAQAAKISVGRNDFTGCFEFHIPVRGSLNTNEAWSWDPRNGGWTQIAYYAVVDERRLFDYIIYGGHFGRVRLGDFDPTVAEDLVLETKPLVMSTAESPHVVTRLDELDILLREAVSIEWRIGCSDEPEGPYIYSDWLAAEPGTKIQQVPYGEDGQPLPEQPYWKLALRNTPGVADWAIDLQGFLLYGLTTGTKM